MKLKNIMLVLVRIYQKMNGEKYQFCFGRLLQASLTSLKIFSLAIVDDVETAKLSLKIPKYIEIAFDHLIK